MTLGSAKIIPPLENGDRLQLAIRSEDYQDFVARFNLSKANGLVQ
jgi:hypothetical protein